MKMKSKVVLLGICLLFFSLFKMNCNAAPKTMPDGTVFDAEFYANTYPDVKEAFGTDEKSLYNHYITYGKAEGRKAFADDNVSVSKISINSESEKIPEVAENIAIAFEKKDFATLSQIASQYSTYEKEIATYMTYDMDGKGKTRMYYIPSSKGYFMLTYYSGEDFNAIINMAKATHDYETGKAETEKTKQYYLKNKNILSNWKDYVDAEYGRNFFIRGDDWLTYVNCKNGYSYTEISTDGKNYDTLKSYPDYPDPYTNQAKSVKFN